MLSLGLQNFNLVPLIIKENICKRAKKRVEQDRQRLNSEIISGCNIIFSLKGKTTAKQLE